MVSTVTARPNHYDTLGISPDAGEEEIGRAFARKMSLSGAQPVGGTARLCIAYETLRNAAKRAEYDRSIGVKRTPPRREWSVPVAQQRWTPFIAAPVAKPAVQAAPAPDAEALPEPEPAPELRMASFIAASLRDLARPTPLDVKPEPQPQPQPRPMREAPPAQPHIQQIKQSFSPARVEDEAFSEDRPFDWRRPALAVGGFVLAAGLIGTLAGMSVRDDEASATPAVTVALPTAKQQPHVVASTAPAAAMIEDEPYRAPAHRSRHVVRRWGTSELAEQQPDATPVAGAAEEAAADPLAPAPVDATEVAASLPIPDKTVARTIERIGYSCGEVASTAAVEGAGPGVYKVTCTSGQTYQASPVHGRYHFRRSGGR